MVPSELVQAPTRRQHRDHPGVGGVDVGEQQERADGGAGGVDRKMGEGPDRVVENRQVGTLVGEPAGLSHCYFVGGDRSGPPDHLVTRCLASCDYARLNVCYEAGDALVDEIAAVAEGKNPDA